LIRGAIAFALTYRIDKDVIRDTSHLAVVRQNTLMIVVFSTVVFGSMMTTFARILGITVEKQTIDE
jgi:hypothetical protein